MGSCSFVELRKLTFCARYSKGDLKKAWQILLGTDCRDGASSLPVHGWMLFSLGQKWQWQSGFGMCALETWCLQHASAIWKQCGIVWQHQELARGWAAFFLPWWAVAQLGSVPSWAGGVWSEAQAAWPPCPLTFEKLSWTIFALNMCAEAVLWLGGSAGRQGVMFCI